MSLIDQNKHSHLLRGTSCVKKYNQRIVNRIMDKQMDTHTNYRNLEPPFFLMASTNLISQSPDVDTTRSKVAFGRWALPKLKSRILQGDIFEIMQGLNSISDLVHDPEKGFEAVRIGLVEVLSNMMLHEKDFVREKICMIFLTLAGTEAGRRAIIRRYKILRNLALLIDDSEDAVRLKAQLVVEMLSLSPMVANGLNCADFLILILRLLGGNPKSVNEDIQIYHLATLKMLLDRDVKEIAMRHNAFHILLEKLKLQNEKIKVLALDCIALLCQDPEGRAEGVKNNLAMILCKNLCDPSMDVRIKAAGAMAFATIQSETRSAVCKKCIIDSLMDVLENFHSSEGQLMAMKVLSNLSEDPMGKPLVKSMKRRIKRTFTNNDLEVDRHKAKLLNLLKKNK